MLKRLANEKKKMIRIGLSLALILALVATLASLPPQPVAASSTEQALIDAREKQEEIADRLEGVRREKNQLSSSISELGEELSWLEQRSEEQRQLYSEKTEQLEAALTEVERAYAEYALAQEDLLQKQEQYVERLKTMFDYRNRSMFEVFLESESIQGFFTTMQFMTIVADTDQQMIEELEAAQDHADLMRRRADDTAAEMEEVVQQIEADLERLRADTEATQLDMNQLSRQLSDHEAAEAALAEESENVGSEIAQLQAQLAAERAARATEAAEATRAAQATQAAAATQAAQATQAAEQERQAQQQEEEGNSESEGGSEDASSANPSGWTWPVPGRSRISSGYGMRTHPVFGYARMHTGIDIPAPYGHPIVAAASGTVIIVRNPVEGQNTGGSGYGNYVVIDHGDGISTLYAHLRDTHVSPMQEVTAGDRIASCGSTGTSTGAHLHFEVMEDGRHTNPLPYVR